MGQNKACLLWDGIPLYQHMTGLLEQAGIHPVMVSGSGYGEASVPDILSDRGPLGGIHAVLRQMKDGERLLVVPVDMPLLPVEALKTLAKQHQPCCFDGYTLPMLLPVAPLLREWVEHSANSSNHKDYSLWRLHRNLQGITLKLPDSMVSAFSNANTPEDWQLCQQQSKSNSNYGS